MELKPYNSPQLIIESLDLNASFLSASGEAWTKNY